MKQFSTKTLTVLESPAGIESGLGVFEFTDDYSVFDYGKMPDRIPDKGEAICRMTAENFSMLEREGIRTHMKKFLPPNRLEFTLLRVIDPASTRIAKGTVNYFVPLQVKFRNSLPRSSSVFDRLRSGEATLASLGLEALPEPGCDLPKALIEYTTKLEETDRFITRDEAQELAGLTSEQFCEIDSLARRVNDFITSRASEAGLVHADGKIEFGIDRDGGVLLVDALGTPDENRFLFHGVELGKQLLRDYYAGHDLKESVKAWASSGLPRSEWPRPPRLPASIVNIMSRVYRSACEAWLQERIWGAPALDQLVEELSQLKELGVSAQVDSLAAHRNRQRSTPWIQ